MLEQDYYPLDDAATILNCNESDLIHLAANECLSIYALVSHCQVTRQRFHYLDLLKELDPKNPP